MVFLIQWINTRGKELHLVLEDSIMIKNKRQYLITKNQIKKFELALSKLVKPQVGDEKQHSLLQKAERDAIKAQLAKFRREIEAYETLSSGKARAIDIRSLGELSQALNQARITLGWSQKELAERMGLKEQQIQRYESRGYTSASLRLVTIDNECTWNNVFYGNSNAYPTRLTCSQFKHRG